MIVIDSYVCGSRRSWCTPQADMTAAALLDALAQREGCGDDVVLQCEGRVLAPSDPIPGAATVIATLRLCGGKGGFGSMLRAIGAQIEKTTNREACRDLSGRRLRDINEEKRLKDFISKKAEREREIQERRRQKFEQLKSTPKHIFQDESYYQQREVREKNLYDSLDKAFGSSDGSGPSGVKRSCPDTKETAVKAKKGRFIDSDLDESSDDDSDGDDGAAVALAKEGSSEDEEGVVAVAREGSSSSSSSDSDENSTPVASEDKNGAKNIDSLINGAKNADSLKNGAKNDMKNGQCSTDEEEGGSSKEDSLVGSAT